jgi:Zn-finger nucleic acid-binding protein
MEPKTVTLTLDPELHARLARVVDLAGDTDLAEVARCAVVYGLPVVEGHARVYAARSVERCPRCTAQAGGAGYRDAAATMSGYDLDDVRLQLCARCGGVWLDNASGKALMSQPRAEALQLAERAAAGATARGERRGDLGCPACEATMKERTLPRAQVVVDLCLEHGTWFDGGELPKWLRAVQASKERHEKMLQQEQALEREAEIVEMERLLAESLMAEQRWGKNDQMSWPVAFGIATRRIRGGYP